MYGIHDAIENNSYTSTESLNYWFPTFYHGYCEQGNRTLTQAEDSEADDFWSDFGDGNAAGNKTFEVEDCTNGEEHLQRHLALMFEKCCLLTQRPTSSFNS